MRTRSHKDANYHSVFTPKGVTLRYKYEDEKPFGKIKHPELLDVAINTKCLANCSYCYTSSLKSGINFPNIGGRIKNFFGPLEDERPYQVALGGAGEPTLHPNFKDAVRAFKELDILPNYTTNGMHLTDEVLEATLEYCGGVAVSNHKHLKWEKAVDKLTSLGVRTNIHVIVGENGTGDLVKDYYNQFPQVETIVILPYQIQGRAKEVEQEILLDEWKNCANIVNSIGDDDKFAFGALFYPFILKNPKLFPNVSIYEPEVFSGYLIMEDNPFVRVSSYNLNRR